MVVEPPVDMSIAHCARVLKSVSAQLILEEQPKFRKAYRRGGFWSTGYSYRVGDTALGTVTRYIAEHNINQATLTAF